MAERRSKTLRVAAERRSRTPPVAAAAVESYEAYVLEVYGGNSLACCVQHGDEGVSERLGWGKSRQEHMN